MVGGGAMETFTLLRAGIKRQRESITGVFILIFFVSLALVAAITVSVNSGGYIRQEMERLGYGDLTAWVSGKADIYALATELESLSDVEDVGAQPLIFAGYTIAGIHSDNEGQLLAYNVGQYPYHILNDNLNGYTDTTVINPGEIYISPSLHSSYQVAIGDKIEFELSRNGGDKVFTVKGYFEDPFMGSSMIDMKSFLISEADYVSISETLSRTSDFDILGRNGAMLHIKQSSGSTQPISALNSEINKHTSLGRHTEFVYSHSSIYGFMMILQNIFTGFLIAFAMILTLVSLIVMGHSISNAIEQEYKDMGILKTIGCTTGRLQLVQLLQYAVGILGGLLLGLLCAIPVINSAARLTITSTGVLMPSGIPYSFCALVLSAVACITGWFIFLKTMRISEIKPIRAINGIVENGATRLKAKSIISQKWLSFHLAIRQLLSGKKRYFGSCVAAILLVFFASVVGRIETWLGPNGEGLMNAFSVAEHDLGVQPMSDVDMGEIERVIASYSTILDTYELAMESVRVNDVDYTANVISEPERFHLLSGNTCTEDNQIIITEFVAADLGVNIGDSVTVSKGSGSQSFTVTGIYECANEMGANIGMNRNGYARIADVNDYIWCYHYILEDGTVNDDIMEYLLTVYRVELHLHTNSWSGLDGIVNTMRFLTLFMYAIVAVFIFVVIALTGSKLLHAEQSDLAILKSIGLSSHRLRFSFAIRFGIVVAIGSVFGIIASCLLADPFITILLKLFGIGEFHSVLGFQSGTLPAIAVTTLSAVFAYVSSYRIKHVDLTSLIR